MEIQDFAETSASILANLLDAPGDFKAVQAGGAADAKDGLKMPSYDCRRATVPLGWLAVRVAWVAC
jgi:hypothetical protein